MPECERAQRRGESERHRLGESVPTNWLAPSIG